VQARTDLAVADYLAHFGYGPGLFRVAMNAARINRASVWSTLRQGLRSHWTPPSKSIVADLADVRSVIKRDVLERAQHNLALVHPWIRAADRTTHGLLWQILSLSVPSQLYESFGGATEIERTPVLMSQPLMEVCLRIPSYIWISGGKDRSIARKAFGDVLPQAVVRRTRKGVIDRYNRKMLDRNVEFVRDTLLDGALVRAGLLDRRALAGFLELAATSPSFEYNEVLRQHLCTEVWIRKWQRLTSAS
jgi:asparagine synthase (glutamine-hydrolysing)